MSLNIAVPKLNPLKYTLFRNVTYYNSTSLPEVAGSYNSLFGNSIPWMEEQVTFCQKVQDDDELQMVYAIILNGTSIHSVDLFDNTGAFVVNLPATTIGTYTDALGDTWTYFLAKLNLATGDYGSGIYYQALSYTDSSYGVGPGNSLCDIFLSEPIWIKPEHRDTVQLHWRNEFNDFDILFTGLLARYNFTMRFDGGWESEGFTPKSNDAIYQDIVQNPVMLSSVPFSTRKITFGRARGIPNYQADIINRILACTDVYVDGVKYCKVPGAKLEPTRTKEYPLAGWRIELQESYENYSEYGGQISRVLGYGRSPFQGNDLIQA